MKKYIFALPIMFVLLPLSLWAHSNETNDVSPGFMMMHRIEDQVLGDEEHEVMEQLMIKMMQGKSLTGDETEQIIKFMEENPGPHSMMMNRLEGMGYGYNRGAHPHYNYGHHGFFGTGTFVGWITTLLIWAILGLAVIALGKHVLKK